MRPDDLELRERGLVDQRDTLTDGAMLLAHGLEPVGLGAVEGRLVLPRLARLEQPWRREPVRPFPAGARAEDGAAGLQGVIERRAADAAQRLVLVAGAMQLVMMAVELDGARIHEVPRGVVEAEATHVQRPEIEAGRP